MDDYRQWFRDYSLVEPNELKKDSEILKVVDLDELDAEFIEERIQQSTPTTPLANNFCHSCQKTFDNWPTVGCSSQMTHESSPSDFPDEKGWETAVARYFTTFEIEGGTRVGCRFCTFLLQGLKDTELLGIYRKVEIRLLHLADCHDEPGDVFTIAKKWMSTCLAEHELCKIKQTALPKRLIQVSSNPPRLVLSSGIVSKPRYVTLSHSWGGHGIIKLTSANFDSFQKALPIEELPQTFRDAIKIAREIGIDYLWVDSLCILQDSETDWEQESALMSTVYGQSSCTIAASSARNSTEALFRKIPFYSGGFRARITDGGQKRVQDFRTKDVYERSVLRTHLATRAWALQEKMLAPRTVHFGERGAFWECRTTLASEFLADGIPRALMIPLIRRNKFFKWLYQWPMIVSLYSAGNLTFGKDKLPALAGVARLVSEETGDEYLAGMWKAQLEEQLCWSRGNSDSIHIRPQWRAPTWSWASIDGRVAWKPTQKGTLETKYAHVVDAHTTKHGKDPFGQVTSGIVRIASSGLVLGRMLTPQDSHKQGAGEKRTKLKLSGDKEREYSISLDCLHEAHVSSGSPLYLLPILGGNTGLRQRTNKDPEEWTSEMMVEGVVLRARDERKGDFCRVGAFSYTKGKWRSSMAFRTNEELYEPFLKLLEERGKAVAEKICAEIIEDTEYPDHRYMMTII
ncbi:HET-domain-containing protein [Venturia nashicola]|uniref:HET-domain-containing protein n=1 Tax=Venturia nashicola TaxID=86259 RepID=A0A4Z1PDS9_9PEZI|nr:HET-domain-containing protein [Venturia nashicola]